ncbi:MAG TPA: Crp/Fnr family transcriptional regulator [Actinomycetota bacterium]|nr:Crp/Fnr family transcriptional regulator [Actinomycetota bacterium]
MRVTDVLARTELFSELTPEGLERVAARGVERTFRKRQILLHAGDESRHLYVLLSGSVKLYVDSAAGDQLHLGRVAAPDVLGLVGVADGGPRSASAEVVEPATVLAIARADLLELFGELPALLHAYLRAVGGLLRRLQERTEDLVFLDLHGRVAKLLLALGDAGSANDPIDLQMTQNEMASMVGGSRPTINQILRTFESRGYISLDSRHLTIRNQAALERLADG